MIEQRDIRMNHAFRFAVTFAMLVAAIAPGPRVLASDRDPAIFDAHIHYSEDAQELLAPDRAIERLTQAGIDRALVSATPGAGAERLYSAAPDRIVPFLRPYPTRAHRETWYDDPHIPGYVLGQLARIPYRGIGEFHVFGEDADAISAREVIEIARGRGLAIHAHTDSGGMRRILARAPETTVIWAHAGFDVPVDTLQRMLEEHPDLYLELSFREGITRDGVLTDAWRSLFTQHPDRFLAGSDTYTPGRWAELETLTRETRQWLRQLPDDVARRIARDNAERLFGGAHLPR